MSNLLKSNSTKKIIWLGPFSPIHANVGDHAQTLAVWQFLREELNDYKIIRVYRDDISVERLSRIVASLNPEDFIFLHSSGDFGSMHDIRSHHPERLSFPEIRRWIATNAQDNPVINLPVTAYYEDNEKGKAALKKDQKAFARDGLTILCREDESLRVVKENLSCDSQFFPDFVFYLRPESSFIQRSGVLMVLRSDREAILSKEQKLALKEHLNTHFDNVLVDDVLQERYAIPDFILEKYIAKVFKVLQNKELVITDKMHGMIMAVVSQTPCIALQGGIPHKISAYKSFLSGAVEFVDDTSEIDYAITRIQKNEYQSVDLMDYFKRFRSEIAGV